MWWRVMFCLSNLWWFSFDFGQLDNLVVLKYVVESDVLFVKFVVVF